MYLVSIALYSSESLLSRVSEKSSDVTRNEPSAEIVAAVVVVVVAVVVVVVGCAVVVTVVVVVAPMPAASFNANRVRQCSGQM